MQCRLWGCWLPRPGKWPSLMVARKMEHTASARIPGKVCSIHVGIPLGPGPLLISRFINCFSTSSIEIMYVPGIWSDLSMSLALSSLGRSALTLWKNSLMRLADFLVSHSKGNGSIWSNIYVGQLHPWGQHICTFGNINISGTSLYTSSNSKFCLLWWLHVYMNIRKKSNYRGI